MIIHGLTVSVGYSEELALGMDRWSPWLASWTIVTDTKDDRTAELAADYGANLIRTDVFYERGASFNKAAAMNVSRETMLRDGWHLFLDADIVPQADWFEVLKAANPKTGTLYGAPRHEAKDASQAYRLDLPLVPRDEPFAGYFQLFHATDPRAIAPLDEFKHAGVYDSLFSRRWSKNLRGILPIYLNHVGARDNWWGKGNSEAFASMKAERKLRGGWEHERIT